MDNLDAIVANTLGRIDFHKIKDHPNILIAARFWEDDRYEAAKTIYRFMRFIDDMIDDRKALDGYAEQHGKEDVRRPGEYLDRLPGT
jgi:hypothetical protein